MDAHVESLEDVMKRFLGLVLGLMVVFGVPAIATAQDTGVMEDMYDAESPDEDWVWEDGYELDSGEVVEGFYRPRIRDGFAWRDGYWDMDVWVPGGWEPQGIRDGYVWTRGFRGVDGYWVPGQWRV